MKIITQLVIVSLVGLLSSCDQDSTDRNRLHIPGPDFKASTEKGSSLFSANCSKCHGVKLEGTDKGPSFLNKVYRPGHHGDMVFHWAVSKGVKQHHWHFGDMPAVAGLSGEDVADITAFVRLEQKKAGVR